MCDGLVSMARLGAASGAGGLEVAEVKAHQDLDSLGRFSDEWRGASGDDAADRLAKLVASRLPRSSEGERDARQQLEERIRRFL
eukprot:3741872-Pyramimonas_sp.AAC.1